MVKKTIAYSLILIAGFILLANAFVPHHHHQEQVCIEITHCETEANAHDDENKEHDHEHDGDNSSNCVLKQVVVFLPNQNRQQHDCLDCKKNHSHDFQFIVWNSFPDAKFAVKGIIVWIPPITPLYSSHLTSSLGLRAPPIV